MTNPTQRHYCTAFAYPSAGFSKFHTTGDGKPRRKQCAYCGGSLLVETGWWGVFQWRGELASYRFEDSLKILRSKTKADDYARQQAHDNLIVRWVSE